MLQALTRWYRALDESSANRSAMPDYLEQQVERSWKKESRNLQWFGLRDGMTVLDLGCGPGHFTLRLADWLPSASITALDADERSIVHARKRLGERAVVVQAPAAATGLPSNAFDFVLARLLFQHLREPLAVAEEALRVLKPGGKLVITDVDDALFGIVDPPIPGFDRLLLRYGRSQSDVGGNRHIGRVLVPLMRRAGFVEPDIEALATHSEVAGLAACLPQFDPDPLQSLVDSGHLTHLGYLRLRQAHKRFCTSVAPFALVLNVMACGTRPAADTQASP